jgi:transaldolase/glucose-6-phosphate isomerase
MNPLQELEACGQSVWTDVISREMLRSGTLARYIDQDGITGVTANPAIFEQAIVGSHDYDESIGELGRRGLSPDAIYQELAIEDVGAAADLLRPVYDRTDGANGFVSIEVSSALADDTLGTIAEARSFWSRLKRPNVMIKVPATGAGIPAIESLLTDGINVNITLIFAIDMYAQVMEAYLGGLEHRLGQGQSIDRIASVASFFVSRVDTLVDPLLDDLMQDADPEQRSVMGTLQGRVAIANAKIAYERFERTFTSPRFRVLARQGARVQRPLWASTSAKNPSYADTVYVSSLIGPNTVNTMTLATIEAFREHGLVDCEAIRRGRDEAVQILDDLEKAGIDLTTVTDRLTSEGVQKFNASLDAVRATIAERPHALIQA